MSKTNKNEIFHVKFTELCQLKRYIFNFLFRYFSRCPDDAPMKLKMRYSSTYKTVKAKAPSLNGSLEAHDSDDLDYKGVPAKAFKK